MLVAATDDRQLNEQIYKDCQEREILCNVVDVPDLCDFYTAAIVRRGHLQIAIGTDGKSPAYSSYLRKKLEHIITDTHGQFLEHVHWARQKTFTKFQDFNSRKTISDQLVNDESFDYFVAHGPDRWSAYADDIIDQAVSSDRS
jgi:siroheme synthase-like protein